MTTAMLFRDILSYSLQLALIVGAGAALAFAFRIREPRVTLACWRTLLAACLLLPLCQPWLTSGPTGVTMAILPVAGVDVVPELSLGGGPCAMSIATLSRLHSLPGSRYARCG